MLLLDTLPSEHVFSTALQSQNHPASLIGPTYNTLKVLVPDSRLCFHAAHLYLVPARTDSPVPTTAQSDLQQLTVDAQQAAAGSLCSSILAGNTSESDDYGDLAVWLAGAHESGAVSFANNDGREEAVIAALGLSSWLEGGAKLVKSTDATVAQTLTSSAALERVKSQIEGWESRFGFRIEGGPHAAVLFALVGLGPSGWQGLVGLGVWS